MDKTLKILLAVLGVAAIAIFLIPSGDPLANASPANPAAPATPGQPSPEANGAVPEYVPPTSDAQPQNNPPGTADSSDLQQSTFGQPMFDPRPASEQQADRNREDDSEGPAQPAPPIQAQPALPGNTSNYYNGPPQGYAQPANNLGYDPREAAGQ